MTEEEMRALIAQQKSELENNKLTIEALQSKNGSDKTTIETLNQQVTDLKVKNHDLFLKVVQEPLTPPGEDPKPKDEVMSLGDLTNKLLGGN